MSPKAILVFCAQALLAQSVFSQCGCGGGRAVPYGLTGAAGLNGLAAPGLTGAYGAGCGGVASTGGGLAVSSCSPAAPVGVSVVSENCYEGTLNAGGNLPFLGTVAFEGVLPTAGAGAVSYGCGDGAVGIVSEGPIATGIVAPETFAPAGIAGSGLGGIAGYGVAGPTGYGLAGAAGLGGLGCGCGAIY